MKKSKLGIKNAIAVVIAFVISFMIILTASVPESYDYHEGDICVSDIFSPKEIEDSATTERRREAAASQVEDKYSINYELNEDLSDKITNVFTSVNEVRSMDISFSGKEAFLIEDIDIDLNNSTVKTLLSIDKGAMGNLSSGIKNVFDTVMDKGVIDEEAAVDEMKALLAEKDFDQVEIAAAEDILKHYVRINEQYDEALTQAEKEKARNLIEPTVYKKNQVIVRRGEVISKNHLEMLGGLGLLKGEKSISKKYALGIFLLLLSVYFAGGYYVTRKDYKNLHTGKLILSLLLTLIMLLILILCKDVKGMYVYLIPIPVGAMLMATFISIRMAVLCSVYISSAATIMLGQTEEFLISMIVFSCFAAIIFKHVSGLSGYAKAMVLMIVVGVGNTAMAMLFAGKGIPDILTCVLYGGVNALISSIIVIGTTPLFENIFDITTPFKLNDLGNPEKPLLKRLMFEAPGTYHHSLMVGNLAEAACIKIGANNQLARVAAYYHDIGKLRAPEYFVENQMGENPHDSLLPEESARILKKHIDFGIEIAKQYRLPKDIQDVIIQHHGTTPTGIFYKKAKELDPLADEARFKYPGPKPESKEAGIVMLADSCEAAVRSLDEKNEETIRAMVTKIIKGRMSDGQLDRCNLSFRELGEITDAFVSMEERYFHTRIKYEEDTNK